VIRLWTCLIIWSVGLLVNVGTVSAAQQPPPITSENLFPDTTQGFAAIANVDRLRENWNKTQIGQLMADPVMKPFAEDLRRQIEGRWSGIRKRLGLELDDIKDVAGGEVGIGGILPAPDTAAFAIVVDTTGHDAQANALLAKVTKNLLERGGKQTQQVLDGVTITVFTLPPRTDALPGAPAPTACYFYSGNLLVASDNLPVLVGILTRAQGKQGGSLATVPAFQEVMQRCAKDNDLKMPQIRWFLNPLGYIRMVRVVTPDDRQRKGKPIIEVLENQGFSAVRGVGGFVDFAAEGFEIIHRTAVSAPGPYLKWMRMLRFPNGADYAPQPWVPRDVAGYSTFYCDILNAFDNFGWGFDELFGGEEFLFSVPSALQKDLDGGAIPKALAEKFDDTGLTLSPQAKLATRTAGKVWRIADQIKVTINGKVEVREVTYVIRKGTEKLLAYEEVTGIWEEVLRSMIEDPNGPQIDLREDLIKHLGQRVTILTKYEQPITPTSERLLFAIETNNPKALAATIRKAMEDDPSAKLRKHNGLEIWEIIEEEESGIPDIDIQLPSLGGEDEGDDEKEDGQARLLPHQAVTVVVQGNSGHLLVASHVDFLLEVLKPREKRQQLGNSVDYQLVNAAMAKPEFKVTQKCAQIFSVTAEQFRPTYELIKQGKMPEGQTMLARVLNTLFGTGEEGEIRKQKIDGSKLPEFQVVRRKLGPAGATVTSESTPAFTGWFIKGITLKQE